MILTLFYIKEYDFTCTCAQQDIILNMKSIKFILNFRQKYILRNTVLPIENKSFSILIKFLPKLLILCFDKISGIQGRLTIASNFLQFIFKLRKNHGPNFTIK